MKSSLTHSYLALFNTVDVSPTIKDLACCVILLAAAQQSASTRRPGYTRVGTKSPRDTTASNDWCLCEHYILVLFLAL
jgi:hypothetical protein